MTVTDMNATARRRELDDQALRGMTDRAKDALVRAQARRAKAKRALAAAVMEVSAAKLEIEDARLAEAEATAEINRLRVQKVALYNARRRGV